jgi:hypothetical protein
MADAQQMRLRERMQRDARIADFGERAPRGQKMSEDKRAHVRERIRVILLQHPDTTVARMTQLLKMEMQGVSYLTVKRHWPLDVFLLERAGMSEKVSIGSASNTRPRPGQKD